MNDNKRQDSGHEWCQQPTTNPAEQPKPPGNECSCKDLPPTKVPEVTKPEKCKPPKCCNCPETPQPQDTCFDTLLKAQTERVADGKKAEEFKKELTKVLDKAKAAAQDYTQKNFDILIKDWTEQDADIVKLIHRLVCDVPCWRCAIECHICSLLEDMRVAEVELYGDPQLYADYKLYPAVRDAYDLQYWLQRDKSIKERRYNRIKSVLGAWESPFKAISQVLASHKTLIPETQKLIGTDSGRALYDIFFRIIPAHLAIAPPRGSKWRTNIDKEFTEFCGCDMAEPDDCCGPNVGLWGFTLRERVTGPLPYLIDPNRLQGVICCLVAKRYGPAQKEFSDADNALAEQIDKIKQLHSIVDDGLKSFEKTAKGAIPDKIDCCDYEPKAKPTDDSSEDEAR